MDSAIKDMDLQQKKNMLRELLKKKSRDTTGERNRVSCIIPDDFISQKANFRNLYGLDFDEIYFPVCQGISSDTIRLQDKEFINFSGYNYLGLNGDPRVTEAAADAVREYGTSVSASRLASGERPIHAELENEIARFLHTESSICFIGGFITNESVIGHLFGKEDLIVFDSYIHSSIQQGSAMSQAAQIRFPHNNYQALDNILSGAAGRYKNKIIIIEGVYSMDGDIPDLPQFIRLKDKYNTLLMVDEAHSLGVLGRTGRGIREYYNTDPDDVDIRMGTLSKSLASCGGYIAGKKDLIQYIKYRTPGFVFSAGITPANTAAALAALRILQNEPERVARLQENAAYFLEKAKALRINTGLSKDSAVIPVLMENSQLCVRHFRNLFDNKILALPIMYPAVPENASRIRFFVSSNHTKEQIDFTIKTIADAE